MMKIPLTQGKVAVIDDDDLPVVSGYKWWAARVSRGNWYAVTKVDGRLVYMHRMLLSGSMIDHRDSDGLNNQRYNLRSCSSQQNSFNRRKRSGTSSRFKGVSRDSKSNRWLAQIEVSGKNMCLGRFEREDEASAAYRVASREHFGDFCPMKNLEVTS